MPLHVKPVSINFGGRIIELARNGYSVVDLTAESEPSKQNHPKLDSTG